ncbi:mycophenolic acid acyl-glucuronide esterase, mitochondrial-like [Acanthaster planci]|uniref:Palmitoyl-protein thioesterase ABHD10, mitochondrial n=1 Tax=Acanthaster planci TaxID=133434 RepID=A0A8B7Z190_ACAPL|nr:mycophenolic acid acyl-glucuronide esterase, mitochondrial-like [Acanthaster planci]XP_022098546.1 mycophenolic acid acyl-glucuronide esterase, mitochondrial-like [Acanthaster planci]
MNIYRPVVQARHICKEFLALPSISLSQRLCVSAMSNSSANDQGAGGAPVIQHLHRQGNNTVAYRHTPGQNPGVMFLPGFMSNMNGGKAVALEKCCQQMGVAYIRFDYQGLGDSRGHLQPGGKAFDVWKSDSLAVLDDLTSGPQILVGSSMGGALMILLALERPQRIAALIGVATAVNFKQPLSYTEKDRSQEAGNPTAEEVMYVTPQDFVDKRYQRCLMEDQLQITCPIRLLHGMKDDTVPYMTSLDVAQRVASKDVDVLLRKDGNHRMSQERDLLLLTRTLETLVEKVQTDSILGGNKL